MNSVQLVGRLADPPKEGGKALFLSVLTVSPNPNGDDFKTFHDVAVFNANLKESLGRIAKEGSLVSVTGKISRYKDQQGTWKTNVTAFSVGVLDGAGNAPVEDENIPF